MWKSIVQPGRPQVTIWRMRIACLITKAADTHSGYVKIIAFRRQQGLCERAPVLRCAYVACLVTVLTQCYKNTKPMCVCVCVCMYIFLTCENELVFSSLFSLLGSRISCKTAWDRIALVTRQLQGHYRHYSDFLFTFLVWSTDCRSACVGEVFPHKIWIRF